MPNDNRSHQVPDVAHGGQGLGGKKCKIITTGVAVTAGLATAGYCYKKGCFGGNSTENQGESMKQEILVSEGKLAAQKNQISKEGDSAPKSQVVPNPSNKSFLSPKPGAQTSIVNSSDKSKIKTSKTQESGSEKAASNILTSSKNGSGSPNKKTLQSPPAKAPLSPKSAQQKQSSQKPKIVDQVAAPGNQSVKQTEVAAPRIAQITAPSNNAETTPPVLIPTALPAVKVPSLNPEDQENSQSAQLSENDDDNDEDEVLLGPPRSLAHYPMDHLPHPGKEDPLGFSHELNTFSLNLLPVVYEEHVKKHVDKSEGKNIPVPNFSFGSISVFYASLMILRDAKSLDFSSQQSAANLGYTRSDEYRRLFGTSGQALLADTGKWEQFQKAADEWKKKSSMQIANGAWMRTDSKIYSTDFSDNFYNTWVKQVPVNDEKEALKGAETLQDHINSVVGPGFVDLKGKIKDLPAGTACMFVNAAKFEMKWEYPFKSDATEEKTRSNANTFLTAVDNPIQLRVNMMHQKYGNDLIQFEENHAYYGKSGERKSANVVILPFEGLDFQAMIVHPKPSTSGANLFDQDFFDAFLSLNPSDIPQKDVLKLSLPRASGISTKIDLEKVLGEKFIPGAFAPHGIGKLVGEDDLMLNKISHKIEATMDEWGAKVEMITDSDEMTMGMSTTTSIKIDSPFMWVLQTKEGVNLAVTVVNSPPKADPVGIVALEGYLERSGKPYEDWYDRLSEADKNNFHPPLDIENLKKTLFDETILSNPTDGCPDQQEFSSDFKKLKMSDVREELREFISKWKDRPQDNSADSN